MDEATASHRIDHVLSTRGCASKRQKYTGSHIVRESNLCKLLYTLFAWGLLPAVLVQRLAKAAHDDMIAWGVPVDPLTLRLSKLGASGEHTSNIRTQLVRLFKPVAGVVQPLWIRVPCIRAKSIVSFLPELVDFPIIMINELFDALFTNFYDYFKTEFGDCLESCWNQVTIHEMHCGFETTGWYALYMSFHNTGPRSMIESMRGCRIHCIQQVKRNRNCVS